MLVSGSSLKGYAIEATDGRIGSISGLLFDDRTWRIRWLIIDTGTWLSGRKVLIHPAAVQHPDHVRRVLAVHLTRLQVQQSPGSDQDEPVSRDMQKRLYGYYGWDPLWGGGAFGAPNCPHMGLGVAAGDLAAVVADQDGDPNLRSIHEVIGYHAQASDGAIGHVQHILVDDTSWLIPYLVVETRNWWPGQHVMISSHAVNGINWQDREVDLNVSREQVKASPPLSISAAENLQTGVH